MIDFLNSIDTEILLFFNGLHCGYFDRFMPIVTAKWTWVPMYATILFILYRGFAVKQATALLLGVVLSIVLADQVCATLIRPVCERLRPANLENPISAFVHVVNGYRGGRYGFPSCHAANSFALATVMSLIIRYRRFTFFIFFWAILNSYSRLYLGVHYPGDLFVGAVIGSCCGALCYFVAKKIGGVRTPAADYTPMQIIYATPAGPLAPVMGLEIVNVRISDIMATTGYATMIVVLLLSLA